MIEHLVCGMIGAWVGSLATVIAIALCRSNDRGAGYRPISGDGSDGKTPPHQRSGGWKT